MNLISLLKKTCYSTLTITTILACALPINKTEARGEGAVAVAAGVGALVGAAIASDAQHKQHQRMHYRARCYIARQQQIMNYVLMNYNPAFHDAWVRYIVVDCSSILAPEQQNQMLNIINQKRDELGCAVPVGLPVDTREVHVRPGTR